MKSWHFALATQTELYLIVVALSINSLLNMIHSLNTGYLSSAFNAPAKKGTISYELKSSQKSFGENRRPRSDSQTSSLQPLTTVSVAHQLDTRNTEDYYSIGAAKADEIVVTKQVDVAFEQRT